jgi:hypothetical protein
MFFMVSPRIVRKPTHFSHDTLVQERGFGVAWLCHFASVLGVTNAKKKNDLPAKEYFQKVVAGGKARE